MFDKFRFPSKGFTLVEILVAIIVLGIISIAVTNFFMGTLNSHRLNSHILQNVNQSTPVLNYIVDEIKYADAFTLPNSGTRDSAVFIYTASSTTYTLTLNAANLVCRNNIPISKADVSAINFHWLSASSVRVTMTIRDTRTSNYSNGQTLSTSEDAFLVNFAPPTPTPASTSTPTP